MTAVNLVLDQRRAALVCDTLVSGADQPLFASKFTVVPHLRVVIGGSGLRAFSARVAAMVLDPMPAGASIEDLAVELPAALRDYWRRIRGEDRTRITLVGVTTAGDVAAFALEDVEDFVARRLAPGLYLSPELQAPGPAGETAAGPTPPELVVRAATQAEIAKLQPWQDRMAAAIRAVELQQRAHPRSIGGAIEVACLDEFSIHVTRLRELPDLGAAA